MKNNIFNYCVMISENRCNYRGFLNVNVLKKTAGFKKGNEKFKRAIIKDNIFFNKNNDFPNELRNIHGDIII